MKTAWQKWTACLLATLMVLGTVFAGPGVYAWAADLGEGDGVTLSNSAAEPGRETINFNNDWRYYEGDVTGADAADFDDEDWLYVNLPHSTIHYTPDNYYQEDLGVFWYRKHFTIPEEMQGKKLYITFEAAMQAAEVWVNGEKVGTHQGGYTAFVFDLTDKVAYGEENVIAVRIDTRPNAAFNPGKNNPDFQYFGGLYRNVYLTAMDPLHVSDAVYENKTAGGGIFLTAPSVTKESATVQAQTDVKNEGEQAQDTTVKTEIVDEDGGVVATKEDTTTIAAGESHAFVQKLVVENPRLWSINTPELYTVRTTVLTGDTVRDSLETTYGIRKVEWKRDGCYINGEYVELNGTNMHSEIGMLGNAQSDDSIFEDVRRLKEWGFDFIRMSHYPHSPAFYAACDKYGVAVIDCLSGLQQFNNTDSFKNATYQELRDMFHTNRNYCSIVAWEPSLNESGYNEAWAKEMQRISHEEYPTDGDSRIYTGGWKYWNVFDMGVGTPQANVIGDAATYSDKPVIVSEYGDWNYGGYTSSTRVTREPAHTKFKGGDEGMLIQCDNLQESMALNRSFDWGGAYAYWQYADYAGFDTTDLTYCGIVDIYRIPKFSAYFVQSQRDADVDLSEYGIESGPMVFVANTWASDSPDQVRVFSNCDEVELFVNGKSIGKQTPDTQMWGPHGDGNPKDHPASGAGKYISTENLKHPPFTFDLSDYTPGEGTITAVGYIDGQKAAEYVRRAPEEATQITLQAENDEPLKLDGSTAKLVWVDVKDANGTVVNTADNAVTFSVDGPGLVIGDKAEVDEGQETKTVTMLGGQMGIWVRSKRGSGDITLTATSNGLTTATLTIPTETVEGLPEVPEGGDADEADYVKPVETGNLFLNKPASASSENTSSQLGVEAAERANDGDETTKWCAKVTDSSDDSVGPHWWQVDMGDTYKLESVEILFEMNTDYKYQIAVSDSPDITQEDVVVDRSSNTENVQRVTEEINQECRYVRVYVNCPASNIWPCILEVKGTGESTNANVAAGKDATASKEGAGHPASAAVDGDPSTYWTNAAMGAANWQVDLGEVYQINQVDVDFVWGNGTLMHTFTLQSSMDGNRWTDVANYSGPDKMASLQVDTQARYLRVYNLYAGDGTKDWTEIAEFYAYGAEAAEETRLDYGVPSYASSSAEGSDPAYGNDGDPAKYWIPSPDDESPWWYFDAGGLYNMSNVQLSWTSEQSHRYTIDLSVDGVNWTTAVDHMDGSEALTLTSDAVSGLARYVRISLPAGSTEGFWINSTGREANGKLVTGVEELAAVDAFTGTAFEDLELPKEVLANLEGDLSTKLPVVWDEDGYKADSAGEQTLTGTLTMIPGVKNSEDVKASIVVNVKEVPEQTITMGLTAPETVAPGSEFAVTHSISGLGELVEPVGIIQMDLTYPEGLTCEEVIPNENIDGNLTVGIHNDEHKVSILYDGDLENGLPVDTSSLFTATFKVDEAAGEGDYDIEIGNVVVLNISGNDIGSALQQATVHVGQTAPETADLTVTFSGKDAKLWIDGEEQTIANLLGVYTLEDVANGEELVFDFTPAVEGRTFRAVTVNGGEPEIIGSGSYRYTGSMDTLNPTLTFAFETVSKLTLQAVIDYAQERIDAGDTDNLVPAVQEKFQKAFDKANEVNEDPAATQDAINEAWSALMDALHYLEFEPGDKTRLDDLIALAETLDENDYTSDTWAALQTALDEAIKTSNDDNAVQNDVDKACQALYDALMHLAGTADRTALDTALAKAEGIEENLDAYLDDGKQEFIGALNAARDIDRDATQEEVDAAAKALTEAMANLRKIPSRAELEALLNRMESKDLSGYTASSAAAFTAAKKNLAAVLDKSNATPEELVAAQDAALLAEKNLKKKTQNSGKGSSSSNSSNTYGASGTATANPVVNAAQSVAEQTSVRCDTTMPFTLTRGSAYCFKMTVLNGSNVMPSFTVGNGSVLKTQFIAQIGNDYYFRVYATGKPGESTGVYTTLPGQNPVRHCVVTIG